MAKINPISSNTVGVTYSESEKGNGEEVSIGKKAGIDFGPVKAVIVVNGKHKDNYLENEDGSITYTLTTDGSVAVKVSADGNVAKGSATGTVGKKEEYRVTVPKANAESTDVTKITPYTMATADVPVGTKLSIDSSDYRSGKLEGSYNKIAAEVNLKEEDSLGIVMEKTGENKIRVTAGPKSALNVYVGAGAKIGDAKLLLGVTTDDKESTLKTAEFDLSTEEGRKGYESFLKDGVLPIENSKDGRAVAGVATIEKKEGALDIGMKFEIDAKEKLPEQKGRTDEVSLASKTEWSLVKNGTLDVVTTHADGRKEIVGSRTLTGVLVPDNSTTITQVFEAPPKEGREETLVSKTGDTTWLTIKGKYAKDGSGESLSTETYGGTTVEIAKKFGAGGVEDTAERRYAITMSQTDAAALNAAFGKQGQPDALAADGKNVTITLTETEVAQLQKMARSAASGMPVADAQRYSAIWSARAEPNQSTEEFIAELTRGKPGGSEGIAETLSKISTRAASKPEFASDGRNISEPSYTPLPGALNAGDAQNRAAPAPTAAQTQTPAAVAPAPAAARTAADRDHPDSPLLAKTNAGVRELDHSIGKPWDGDSERLSASAFKMAVAMNFKPGDDIAVGLNRQTTQHAAGELLMVHRQGANASPDPSANHASMPLAEALAKPADQRLQEADAIRQGQGIEAQRQQEQPTREQDTRTAKAPAAP
ncbi:XVIPCD domain-containing protein [Lysobacter sp. CA199]|uniref:XVIPCD domain-containing protein n=1 Tax=Lysobacter sp. CA199 TaxID=3455608 RepID=UPI003F8D7EE3